MEKINKTKETLSGAVLDVLKLGAAGTIDVLDALMWFSKAGYYKRLKRGAMPERVSDDRTSHDFKIENRDRSRFYAILSKLKKQGLVETSGDRGNRRWQITKIGLAHSDGAVSVPVSSPMVRPGGMTIVSYDIPESKRRVRRSLRELLKVFGFECIQKSVWFGNKKLTKEFMEMLSEREVLDCVHIFEISKTGTIEQVIDRQSAED